MKRYSYLYKVKNKKKYISANDYYILAITKAGSLLFTEKDVEAAKQRAEHNPEDSAVDELVLDSNIFIVLASFITGLLIGLFW